MRKCLYLRSIDGIVFYTISDFNLANAFYLVDIYVFSVFSLFLFVVFCIHFDMFNSFFFIGNLLTLLTYM